MIRNVHEEHAHEIYISSIDELHESAWATITECHRWSGYTPKINFSPSSEGWKLETRVPTGPGASEGLLPSWLRSYFLLCSHMAEAALVSLSLLVRVPVLLGHSSAL